jgi:hypothetical protein
MHVPVMGCQWVIREVGLAGAIRTVLAKLVLPERLSGARVGNPILLHVVEEIRLAI